MNTTLNQLMLTSLTALAVAAAPAYAGGRNYDSYRGEYAQVVSATPIYSQVRVSTPRQECRDERVVYREPSRSSTDDGIATLFGAALGGVAGHQFGKGRGNAAATAAGALIGAGIAQNRNRDDGYTERVAYEPRCTSYSETRYEDRIDGYDVTYRYNGRTYNTRMPYNPGSRIPVDVQVSPVRDY